MSEQVLRANILAEAGTPVEYKEAGLGDDFANRVLRRQKIVDAINRLEAQREILNDSIETTMTSLALKGVVVSGWKVAMSAGRAGKKSIDAGRLMDLGVTSDIIQKATVQAPDGKPYLVVTPRKGGRTAGAISQSPS